MNVITLISIQALERSKRDAFVKTNWKIYRKEIIMLTLSEGNRPAEKIGDFFVTPRGSVKHRIAWHFSIDNKTNIKTIYIDDILYHVTPERYVDDWNKKVRAGKINLGSYGPYIPFQ